MELCLKVKTFRGGRGESLCCRGRGTTTTERLFLLISARLPWAVLWAACLAIVACHPKSSWKDVLFKRLTHSFVMTSSSLPLHPTLFSSQPAIISRTMLFFAAYYGRHRSHTVRPRVTWC